MGFVQLQNGQIHGAEGLAVQQNHMVAMQFANQHQPNGSSQYMN